MLRRHFQQRGRELGLPADRAMEVFTVTAWGNVPSFEQLLDDLPDIVPGASRLETLRQRLQRWRRA